jgi:hypothetical protein
LNYDDIAPVRGAYIKHPTVQKIALGIGKGGSHAHANDGNRLQKETADEEITTKCESGHEDHLAKLRQERRSAGPCFGSRTQLWLFRRS